MDPKATFPTARPMSRSEIAQALNVDVGRPEFKPDDGRLTDAACTVLAMHYGQGSWTGVMRWLEQAGIR